ncbi:MAG: leucine-rich repeat domain-containing protein [Paludibacter sp.]|nr:leucine-rich repeat domain-containing protein [Paludibacter sp.]
MKKLILLSFSLTALFALQAVSIHVTTPGTLSTLFTASEKTTTTELTLTGNINASDVKCLRDEFTNLSVLNLSSVFIDAYNGNGGTSTYYSYPANEMPVSSFFNSNTGGKKTLTSVHLPNSITSIGESAFCNCDELTSMTIPAEVEFIGMNAFVWCTKLSEYFVKTGSPYFSTKYGVLYNLNQTKLIQYPNGKHGECVIPATVTSIAISAFTACIGLSGFALEGENSTYSVVDSVLFSKNLNTLIQYPTGKIGNYTVPNFVDHIGYAAFDACDGLTNVMISDSVKTIATSAFAVCRNLLTVTIGKSVASIGDNAFAFCGKQTAFNVHPDNLSFAVNNGVVFNKNHSTLVLYPAGKQGDYEIPNTVSSIGRWAFYSSKITGVSIPNTVTSIGNSAFFYCKNITHVVLPNSITSIDENAFGSSDITSINLPIGLTYMGHSAFSYCTALTSITIPETMTSIEEYTFQHCSALSEVFFPATLKTIGANAFRNCTGLSGVLTIPNSVTSIGSYAFLNCQSLTGVNIENSINSIGRGSFLGCVNITNLTLSRSVTSIDSYAFSGCSSLTSIFAYPVTPVDLSAKEYVFNGVNEVNCTLYVPIGSKSLYQNAIQWKDFANIVESLTGLSPLSLQAISLYPNPVTSGFRIKGMEGVGTLTLMDLTGKLLITKQVTANEYISVSDVASGIYTLRITVHGSSTNRKLVIN